MANGTPTDTICPSVAALEVVGGASCNKSWNPVPAVAVAVELLTSPSPANTSSLFDVVVAVRPVFGDVPEPCAWAVWSSPLTPANSNTASQGWLLVAENVAVTVLGLLAALVA